MAQRNEVGEREAVEGREQFLFAERGQRWGESVGKAPPPKAAGKKVEKWKQPQRLNKEERKEKGEGLNSIKTLKTGGAQSLKLCSSVSGGALVGRVNPLEQSGVQVVHRPHKEKRFHCWTDIWQKLCGHPVPEDSKEQLHLLVLEQGC